MRADEHLHLETKSKLQSTCIGVLIDDWKDAIIEVSSLDNPDFLLKSDEFLLKHDEFLLKYDDCCRSSSGS